MISQLPWLLALLQMSDGRIPPLFIETLAIILVLYCRRSGQLIRLAGWCKAL